MSENQPHENGAILEQALRDNACAMFICDLDGQITWVNGAFCRLTGYAADELVGQSPSILRSGRQDSLFYRKLWRTILSGDAWRGEVANRRKDGSLYTAEEAITPLFDASGDVRHFVALQFDLAPRKREATRQRYLAFHDTLTRLLNRNGLEEKLKQAIGHHSTVHGRFSVLFIDLDQFKPVNDSFGHHMGDMVLMAVANRLRAAVRSTDVVARLGGDEFVVVESNLHDVAHSTMLAEKLVATLGRPFRLAGKDIRIGASIGIALYPDDADNAQSLLAAADEAMYRAKAAGRGCVRTFET